MDSYRSLSLGKTRRSSTEELLPSDIKRIYSMGNYYVFGYINPDTDGVCSAITYADYLRKSQSVPATAVILGEMKPETKFVLRQVGIERPPSISHFQSTDKLYIVDTHQLNQLPTDLPLASVVEILDHHPSGNPEAFSNAVIVNEKVGAVATLIAEKYKNARITPDEKIAALLYSAIVSNTLDFKAPSTTDRDRTASDWTLAFANFPDNYVDMMFQARSDLEAKSTLEILMSDYKEFDFSGVKVGISQIETTDLETFLAREDLALVLQSIQRQKRQAHILFNGVDIRRQVCVLVTPEARTCRVLEAAVGASFSGYIAHFNRILLRKSDITPQLTEYFQQNSVASSKDE